MKEEISWHSRKNIGYWPVQMNGNKFETGQIVRKAVEALKGWIWAGWVQKSPEPWVSLEWNSQFISTHINFSCHHFRCFTTAHLFVLDKSTAWNMCLQHPCFNNLCKIAQASKNQDSNTRHFLSGCADSRFHSMLFALPGHQFPYTGMNRCSYLIFWRATSLLRGIEDFNLEHGAARVEGGGRESPKAGHKICVVQFATS